MSNKISCPFCNKQFDIDEISRKQIEEEILTASKTERERELKEAEEKIRKEFAEKNSLEMADLKKIISEKEKKIDDFQQQELKLREDKRKLEEDKKEFELQTQRRFDEERKKIEEETMKKSDEQHRLRDLEKDKKINDLSKALEDAQRKAQQGSQQTQGEVLELDLEENLRLAFPQDTVEPVGKGIRGADIRQTVKSPAGRVCGVILWETKRTKAWSDDWPAKLKEDLRAEGADIGIIVSEILPKEAESGIGMKDGVWVTKLALAIPIAFLLRKNLLELAYQKFASGNKERKADFLYEYVTGHEFRQQLEAVVEVYQEMRGEIEKERAAMEKIWKTREFQLRRMLTSTANMCGSMQGIIGSSVLQIKGLELLEAGKEEEEKEK